MRTTRRSGPILVLGILLAAAGPARAKVGDDVAWYPLQSGNQDVRGLAFDEDTGRLYVLDSDAEVFVYAWTPSPDALTLVERRAIPAAGAVACADPRGLALAHEDGRRVLYLTCWRDPAQAGGFSRLWRWEVDTGHSSYVDLTQAAFGLSTGEVTGVAYHLGRVYVAFDASTYPNATRQVRRGVLRLKVGETLQRVATTARLAPGVSPAPAPVVLSGGGSAWSQAQAGAPVELKHMPGSGNGKSLGLCHVPVDDVSYLFGTANGDNVYAADAATGRAVFFFKAPYHLPRERSPWGLCAGGGWLWISERVDGTDFVHRVRVLDGDDALVFEGARRVRRLTMEVTATPRGAPALGAGWVRHNYSHPYAAWQLKSQGVDDVSRVVTDLTGGGSRWLASNDPADDAGARQWFSVVEYDAGLAMVSRSRFEVDMWTRETRPSVYPHRAARDACPGAGWLADDDVLYRLSDRATYEAFVARVADYIEHVYGEPADMSNPYWAARNVTEYLLEHYHYPNDEIGKIATEDPAHGHFNANPANLKLALSEGAFDGDEIIACSGTSVMVAGAMRHLGIPARWIGTSAEQRWRDGDGDGVIDGDLDRDGFLDTNEATVNTNGHRYTEVWLGARYGWTRFDATPGMPANDAYDAPPAKRAQWDLVQDHAACGNEPYRLVLNVGSERVDRMFRIYEPSSGPIDRDAGDQRYNLQGRFERPEWWSPGHSITTSNACALTVYAYGTTRVLTPTARVASGALVTSPAPAPGRWEVSWTLTGRWDLDPDATLSVYAETLDGQGAVTATTLLVSGVDADQGSVVVAPGVVGSFRFKVVKDGDSMTGDRSVDLVAR